MDYTLMTSLEHTALIKTAITIWNEEDVRVLAAKCMSEGRFFRSKWKIVEDKVIGKVQELPLPKSLKMKVLGFIKPIGLEMRKKRVYAEIRYIREIDEEKLNMLCWTSQGTIDEKKTAEAIINDENLDIQERYRLACKYCLKDDILRLWKEMPESCRERFYSEKGPKDVPESTLVVFWTYNIKGEMNRLNDMVRERWGNPLRTAYQYAFVFAVCTGNKVATEYFLQELSLDDRGVFLVFYAKYAKENVFIFLLSKMNEEQQIKVFESYPSLVLVYLLDWPWQGFFMETAKRMWAFLSSEIFWFLLHLIINKVKNGFMDYNYQKLFGEFWQQSPLTHKAFVIDECASKSLLLDLFQIKDKENIQLILKSATFPDREKIIFSNTGKITCEKLIDNEETDLLEFFIQECISSKDLMIKFREEIEEHVMHNHSKEALGKHPKFSKFFHLLNDLIEKYDKKRGQEEGNCGPPKRLCS